VLLPWPVFFLHGNTIDGHSLVLVSNLGRCFGWRGRDEEEAGVEDFLAGRGDEEGVVEVFPMVLLL
jgi:hypothetical protein